MGYGPSSRELLRDTRALVDWIVRHQRRQHESVSGSCIAPGQQKQSAKSKKRMMAWEKRAGCYIFQDFAERERRDVGRGVVVRLSRGTGYGGEGINCPHKPIEARVGTSRFKD